MTAPTLMPVRSVRGRLPQPGFSSFLCRANWPRLRHSLAAGVFFICTAAHAGGLEEVADAPDPCPPGVVTGVTGEMLVGFMAIRQMTCGEAPVRAFFDRRTGERLTDDEITRRIFNGHSPAVIPLPGTAWAMLAGLGALAWVGRRRG